jgi:hypothetical protein
MLSGIRSFKANPDGWRNIYGYLNFEGIQLKMPGVKIFLTSWIYSSQNVLEL